MNPFSRFTRFADVEGAHDRYPLLEVIAKARVAGLHVRAFLFPTPVEMQLMAAAAIPLVWLPFKGSFQITQGYRGAAHPAIDWGMNNLTPIYASFPGQVVSAGYSSVGYAYHVAVQNDDLGPGLYSLVAHLDKKQGIQVSKGQVVQAGELIGLSDNTGNSTGPHLHLELRTKPYRYAVDGFDPLPYLVAQGTPVDWTSDEEETETPDDFLDYPGSIPLDGMDVELLPRWSVLNIRSGPGATFRDIGDLRPVDFPLKARRVYAPSLWIEFEPGKWCAVAHGGYQYLRRKA